MSYKIFRSFLQNFNNEYKTTYKLTKTLVYIKNNKWVVNISGEKNSLNIDFLEKFEQEAKKFINDEIQGLILNLHIDICFLFVDFHNVEKSDLWIKIFNYLWNKIINHENNEQIFYVLKDTDIKITNIDFQKNICHIKIQFPQYSQEHDESRLKELIIKLDEILKNKYKSNLSLVIHEINYSSLPQIIDNYKSFIKFNDIPVLYNEILDFQKKNNKFWIKGYVQQISKRENRNKQITLTFYLIDPETKQDSIFYRNFLDPKIELYKKIDEQIQEGNLIEILTSIKHSNINYKKDDFCFQLHEYNILNSVPLHLERIDNYEGKKRIEFHLHTKMSNLDATNNAKDYIETAIRWGHEAIAFTDHNGLYAYPEIDQFSLNKPIKPILGVESNFIEEKPIFITNQEQYPEFNDFILKQHKYVVFDIETTGFSEYRDKIIEISAVKIENGKIIDSFFDELINPEVKLNKMITELTGITAKDLENKPTIEDILPNFFIWIKGYVLVAHNYHFDIGFLKEKAKHLNISFKEQPFIDTLALSQKYFETKLKYFSLKKIAKYFKSNIEIKENYHRALFDARVTANILLKIFDILEEQNILNFYDLKGSLPQKFERHYHVNILVRNQIGYKNLFHLVSDSLTKDFYKTPRLLKSNFEKYREGLLIGSGCFEGNVFQTALNKNDTELSKVISFYDYIEVQPVDSYKHVIYDLNGDDENNQGKKIIQEIILKIIKEAQKQNKIVIATGDVHYLNPYDKIYREIYINAKLIGGGLHKLYKYKSNHLPDNYFLTTQEMLNAFDFINDHKIKEDLVINNTHLLNDKIEQIRIFPKKLFSLKDDNFAKNLKIPSIKKEIKKLIKKQLNKIYGKDLHPLIEQRIKKELKSIVADDKHTDNNIAPIYYLAYLLAKKSIENDYPVGSRGSIGSSFVATLLGITEVNPLKPHYICPQCQYTVFPNVSIKDKKEKVNQKYIKLIELDVNNYADLTHVLSGYDLPNMNCPFCTVPFLKDGQDIPFETFLGFEGNKTPDIDLNFAGDYQPTAHNYMKELLGEDCVFRAGTIQTVATQTAFGYIKGFVKDKELEDKIRPFEISRRANVIEGVKRSTGQHPGGIVVIPHDVSIYEITPIQFPANDVESNWKTTHFDYHSFEDNLFKMDILGHDDPILIKFFMDYVKQKPEKFSFDSYQNIPVDDPKVYKLFSNENLMPNNKPITTIAIPEFGTFFVKNMLKDIYTKEKKDFTFGSLVKVSGLSHGTDVWTHNVQDILNKKRDFSYLNTNNDVRFSDIIGCRDDIMLFLMQKNISPSEAFEIMELVRKGKQKDKQDLYTPEWKKIMNLLEQEKDIPKWYLDSLSKIKYLFPKAHAAAYVLMAIRIAWFKVYHPLLFYSGVFSTRLEQFDYDVMLTKNFEKIDKKIENLVKKNEKQKNTAKEQNLINTLNIASEMIQRGFNFLPIDLNKSEAFEFVMHGDNSLIMPFITLEGLGEKVAHNIVAERSKKLFTQEDFHKRVKLNKTISKRIVEDLKLVEQLPLE
ncbi:exonuclease domain-containing protein [Candidatus Phytoplasma fraxini]|uniref:DNA polymerase III PolC-type n=1 Tax=Ash yellows phytoplasma TaxID=35780 RepID=A0ABZ2U8L2_ASHYP